MRGKRVTFLFDSHYTISCVPSIDDYSHKVRENGSVNGISELLTSQVGPHLKEVRDPFFTPIMLEI